MDKDALDVKLSLPKTSVYIKDYVQLLKSLLVQWDASPTVMLTLHSGRNDIEEAIVHVHGPTGVTLRLIDTTLLDDSLGESST